MILIFSMPFSSELCRILTLSLLALPSTLARQSCCLYTNGEVQFLCSVRIVQGKLHAFYRVMVTMSAG